MTETEIQQVDNAKSKIRGFPISLVAAHRSALKKIRARARSMMAQRGLDLLIVDYLGLIECPGHSQYGRVTTISRELSQLAIELDRPVLCLAQLNRESANAKPDLENLRDSGSIEQDATNVWLLYRRSRESTTGELIVAKQRQGAVGTVDLSFDRARMRFAPAH